jgi:hypothetical protein
MHSSVGLQGYDSHAPPEVVGLDAECSLDVEASRAVRQAEVGAARTMLERTEERFGALNRSGSPPIPPMDRTDAELVGRGEADHAAHPCHRQVEARGPDLLA